MRLSLLIAFASALLVSACATVTRYALEDRFQAIGVPQGIATCMVDDLEQRLSQEDLQDLARYTFGLARADSTVAAIRSLMTIDNPRAVTAVGKAGVACVTGFRL